MNLRPQQWPAPYRTITRILIQAAPAASFLSQKRHSRISPVYAVLFVWYDFPVKEPRGVPYFVSFSVSFLRLLNNTIPPSTTAAPRRITYTAIGVSSPVFAFEAIVFTAVFPPTV